jgi:RNA 2',3'-cyclic 3'-phosphodiesterase
MMRLFVGLGLSDEARGTLWNAVSGRGIAGQFVTKENFHVTMAFLGERDERQTPHIQRIVQAAAREHSPLTLGVGRLGFFGRRDNALLYAELAPCPQLVLLSDTLRRLLTEAGEAFDPKPFVAHVTLARKANLTQTDLRAPLPTVFFRVNRLTLYHSTRMQGDLRYLPVFQAPFEKDDTQA